jgi:hypothetical protein
MVLTSLKPGRYVEFDGSRILMTLWDSVRVEKLEASGMLRYWTGARFQTIYTDE